MSLEYLKYDVKLLKNDVASYDNIEEIEAVNVYLPFINVNNYLIDIGGEIAANGSSKNVFGLSASKTLNLYSKIFLLQ